MKKNIRILPLLFAMTAIFSSCGDSSENKSIQESKYVSPEVINNTISIAKSDIGKEPLYVNYDSNGTIIQLISVVADNGTYRLSLNTCQSCNPSPKAYFLEENGKLVCQNCGNEFTNDDVGISAIGCNPMNIEYTENDDNIVISVETLDMYESLFTGWQGITAQT